MPTECNFVPEGLERCDCGANEVLHVFNRTIYFMNQGMTASHPIDLTVRYECASCGRELRMANLALSAEPDHAR